MVDAARTKKVHALYLKTVAPLEATAGRSTEEALAELDDSMAQIDYAIKENSDPELLETCQRDLKIDMKRAMDASIDVRKALLAIDDIAKDDDDFEADQDEIKKGKLHLLEKMDRLKTAMRDGDARRQNLEKAIAAGKRSAVQAIASWINLMTFVDKRESDLEKTTKAWMAAQTSAEAAVRAGDASALKAVQGHLPADPYTDVLKGDFSAAVMREGFAKKFPAAGLPDSVTDRMRADIPKLKQTDARLQAMGKKCGQAADAISRLQVKPRDAKKAVKLLKLPDALAVKLVPILALDDVKGARLLAELAKQNKIALDGREAVAKLRRAGI